MIRKNPFAWARMHRQLALLLCAAVLSACGGGGGGSASATISPTIPPTSPSTPTGSADKALVSDCSGTFCSATDSNTYSGSGIGVWTAANGTASPVEVPISISMSGASGKSATLVWSNANGSLATAPSSVSARVALPANGDNELVASQLAALEARREAARALQPHVLKSKLSDLRLSMQSLAKSYMLSDQQTWHESIGGKTVNSTLRGQESLNTGQKVNVWVENSEWLKGGTYQITQSLVDLLSQKFASTSGSGIFGMLTSLAGSQPWGSHNYPSSLIGASQDIQIVVTNLSRDNSPGGIVGYFDTTNNYLKTAAGASTSNEALMFFLDSETLASTAYRDISVSTLAHEFTHMVNFYQYTVKKSTSFSMFDTWYDEMLAMMAEDIVDTNLGSYNSLRDTSFKAWVNSSAYNCDLTAYVGSGSCFSYDIYAAYGGYLLRHYGLGIFKALAQTSDNNGMSATGKVLPPMGLISRRPSDAGVAPSH